MAEFSRGSPLGDLKSALGIHRQVDSLIGIDDGKPVIDVGFAYVIVFHAGATDSDSPAGLEIVFHQLWHRTERITDIESIGMTGLSKTHSGSHQDHGG
nr:hypothetical protein [Halanaeroarchaeum sp. HSR-CO]